LGTVEVRELRRCREAERAVCSAVSRKQMRLTPWLSDHSLLGRLEGTGSPPASPDVANCSICY
jgi:hypothetical protein